MGVTASLMTAMDDDYNTSTTTNQSATTISTSLSDTQSPVLQYITPIGAVRRWRHFSYKKHTLLEGLAHDTCFIVYINWLIFDRYEYISPTPYDWTYDDRAEIFKYMEKCAGRLEQLDVSSSMSDDATHLHLYQLVLVILARASLVAHYAYSAFFSRNLIHQHALALLTFIKRQPESIIKQLISDSGEAPLDKLHFKPGTQHPLGRAMILLETCDYSPAFENDVSEHVTRDTICTWLLHACLHSYYYATSLYHINLHFSNNDAPATIIEKEEEGPSTAPIMIAPPQYIDLAIGTLPHQVQMTRLYYVHYMAHHLGHCTSFAQCKFVIREHSDRVVLPLWFVHGLERLLALETAKKDTAPEKDE